MKKLIAVLEVIAIVFTAFAACSKTPVENNTTTPAGDTTAAADTTAAEGDTTATEKPVLKMGTNATFPPYEFYEGEKIVGIDAEVAALIAEKLGMQLEIVDMDFNSILSAVDSGIVDIGMAGMTVNEERLAQVDFTDSYAKGVQAVIVKADSDIKTIDDLQGKTIGVQETTTGDIYATDDFGEENIKRYNKGTDAVAALVNGTVDAVIIDNEPAKAFVSEAEGLTVLESSYADEDYAIAVKKGNKLLSKVNTALGELIADGSVKTIVDKYIAAE